MVVLEVSFFCSHVPAGLPGLAPGAWLPALEVSGNACPPTPQTSLEEESLSWERKEGYLCRVITVLSHSALSLVSLSGREVFPKLEECLFRCLPTHLTPAGHSCHHLCLPEAGSGSPCWGGLVPVWNLFREALQEVLPPGDLSCLLFSCLPLLLYMPLCLFFQSLLSNTTASHGRVYFIGVLVPMISACRSLLLPLLSSLALLCLESLFLLTHYSPYCLEEDGGRMPPLCPRRREAASPAAHRGLPTTCPHSHVSALIPGLMPRSDGGGVSCPLLPTLTCLPYCSLSLQATWAVLHAVRSAGMHGDHRLLGPQEGGIQRSWGGEEFLSLLNASQSPGSLFSLTHLSPSHC